MALNSPSSWNIIPANSDVTVDDVYLYSKAIFTTGTVTKKSQSVRVDLNYNKKLERVQEAFGQFPVLISRQVTGITDEEESRLTQLFKKYGTPYSSTDGASTCGETSGSHLATETLSASGKGKIIKKVVSQPRKRPAPEGTRKLAGAKQQRGRKEMQQQHHYETIAYDDCEEVESGTEFHE